ncbi:MAG: hypothetical protein K9L98_02045 [Candidatus Pacebacteria bacterium]|nr:hypothetical protein [Candidatus Paceibacterota bacterium]MCF7862768.1 hypothetical protein [Candidatus Paceibacterota bacterium]
MNLNNQTNEEFDIFELDDISSFFDLLAKFDYEDKQKEMSALKTDPLVSAPRGPVLGSNI